ncbi:hypothetical protein [Thermostichus vulcanus]|uniref:Uncharacterized protein n=1 Tax=Thermostichus vulcanus str. 'Rupite' TaxID=2813851 RepID=A0ABT0C6Y4_THEVL|nr:hypothetical protein [Thermostichus vulcanus]MCJ2541545.1 hypothetical protein [Thermostichus vulcanus str. 'Rupite']
MNSAQRIIKRSILKGRNRWMLLYEKGMALIALSNLCLVLFDLSYVPGRDFWLQGRVQIFGGFGPPIPLPILSTETSRSPVTDLYDRVKGIEPNPETQQYLELVDELRQVTLRFGVESEPARQILFQLRARSNELIDTNPFQAAGKTGQFVRILNLMREHMQEDSARAAFSRFWTPQYLATVAPEDGIEFFQSRLRPLFEINYSRPIGESGNPVDFFPALDFPFVLLFGLEFLLRTVVISRRYTGVNWLDAMLWRWYDALLLLPFWRWLRVIPVTIRLGQSQLLDLERVRAQVSQGFVTNFAEDLTEVVVVRVINQIQGSIQRGSLPLLSAAKTPRDYIDINETNEIEAIANILIRIVLYRVLPQVQPDVEQLLRYNLDSLLKQLPAIQTLERLPGLGSLPSQLTQRLASELTTTTYQTLTGSFEDPVGSKLTAQLTQRFGEALVRELSQQHALEEIRSLLRDLLEEIKINYVERLSHEDLEEVMEQTRKLRQKAQQLEKSRGN